MFCGNCGQKLDDSAITCPNCGAVVRHPFPDMIYAEPEEPVAAPELPDPDDLGLDLPDLSDEPEVGGPQLVLPNPVLPDPVLPEEPAQKPLTEDVIYEAPKYEAPVPEAPAAGTGDPTQSGPAVNTYSYAQTEPVKVQPANTSGVCIAALVLAILSAISCCLPIFSIPCAIGGIICGIIGLKKQNRTMALISLIISIVFLIISAVITFGTISLMANPEFTDIIEEFDQFY